MATIYITITNHGFGHAARTGSIVSELGQIPGAPRIIVNSTLPEVHLRAFIRAPFELHPRPLDTGVVQSDGLGMDLPATLEKLSELRQNQARIIAEEARFVRDEKVELILGDIPPLAAEIGAAAGVPCWMQGNFGWDFIYRDFGPEFEPYVETASRAYEKCELLFQMPFHEPMGSFPNRQRVGVTGRRSEMSREETLTRIARHMGREPAELLEEAAAPLIMIMFGGMGLDNIPWANADRFNDDSPNPRRFLTYSDEVPDRPNILRIPPDLRAADILPHCESVVTKPGYGTMADVYQADIGIITIRRTGFAEAPILEDALRKYFRHRIIETEDFFQGDWSFITQPLHAPTSSDAPGRNGNGEIVNRLRDFLARA